MNRDEALDVDSVPRVSVRNLLADTADDWFRDPWGYPELRIVGGGGSGGGFGALPRTADEPVTLPAQIEIPKAEGRTRPASFLMPLDRLRYQISVDCVAGQLLPARGALAFGWRAHVAGVGRYRSQRREWADCLAVLRENARTFQHMVFVDIADFFGSIRMDLLLSVLEVAGRGVVRRSRARRELEALFAGFYSEALAHPGIPQNHQPSAVLANAYVDAALGGLECSPGQVSVVRWMDDIWIFGRTQRLAQEILRGVVGGLGGFGLALNSQKTRVYEGAQVAAAVEGTTVRSPVRAEAGRSGPGWRCEEVNERWKRLECADARVVDGLAARLLYGHQCSHPRHPEITAAMIPVMEGASALGAETVARFQLASWWLAVQEPVLARELLRSALPRITDTHNARSCVLAAVDAGESPRWLLDAARHAPVDRLLMNYLSSVAVRRRVQAGRSASALRTLRRQ